MPRTMPPDPDEPDYPDEPDQPDTPPPATPQPGPSGRVSLTGPKGERVTTRPDVAARMAALGYR